MTQRLAPIFLNTSEFKSGLGEIVNLVSDASEKTNPKVIAHIEKFSKKAQDEIYGRFNEAFNNGVKDAAKGRKFLEDNLDFRSLTEKVTEVAEDIELAGEINELFKKNAPIQTIHGQYNKLSLSARKEIQKHLTTTAEKAKSQDLEKALVKVFNGMGRLASETIAESNSSSSSIPPSLTSSKFVSEDLLKARLLMYAKQLRIDIDLANSDLNLLEQGLVAVVSGGDANAEFARLIDLLYKKLSSTAQLCIKKIVSTTQGQKDAFHYQEAIRRYFKNYLSWSSQFEDLSAHWNLSKPEAFDVKIYLMAAADFSTLLPSYGRQTFIWNDDAIRLAKEFDEQAKALLPKIDLAKYTPQSPSTSIAANEPASKKAGADDVKNALQFANMFLKDYKILKQYNDSKNSQETVNSFKTYQSLSPFAQLIIEQNCIINYRDYVPQNEDTMSSTVDNTKVKHLGDQMSKLFTDYNTNETGISFIATMKLDNLSKEEQLLLKTYFSGYPRQIAKDFLKSTPDASQDAFEKHLINRMENLPAKFTTEMKRLKEFKAIVSELLGKRTEYLTQFVGQTKNLRTLTKDDTFEALKKFLVANLIFTKKDFMDQVLSADKELLIEQIAQILKQQ